MSERTLQFVEYQPRVVRLRATEVAALAPWAPFIELVPTAQRHAYRITALGHIGVLHAGPLRVVVQSKLPAANLYHLLEPDTAPVPDTSTPQPGTEALVFLAQQLIRVLHERAAHGLPRSSIELQAHEPYLHGRLDIAAQVRDGPTARERFHLNREEFTVDTPLHQLLKGTALELSVTPALPTGLQTQLRHALLPLSAVSVPPSPRTLLMPSRDATEQRCVDLCSLLLHGLQPSAAPGATQGSGFLIDMAHVFERYVTRGLQTLLPHVSTQQAFCYHAPVPTGQPSLIGRPDLTIGPAVRCVLDVKWKALRAAPVASDVHQALAYAIGCACRDVRLLYPGPRNTTWTYHLPNDHTLTVQTLRVVGTAERCQTALRRLCATLR